MWNGYRRESFQRRHLVSFNWHVGEKTALCTWKSASVSAGRYSSSSGRWTGSRPYRSARDNSLIRPNSFNEFSAIDTFWVYRTMGNIQCIFKPTNNCQTHPHGRDNNKPLVRRNQTSFSDPCAWLYSLYMCTNVTTNGSVKEQISYYSTRETNAQPVTSVKSHTACNE